jgi:cell division protein FtsL
VAGKRKKETMNQLTQSEKNATILPVLIALVLACFALSPQAHATCQEGCLTNNNTAVKSQASQIQKVSAQLEASRPAPQMVNNP